MAFHPTDYFEPSTPEEVSQLLLQYGKNARIISGGTAIYEMAKRDLAPPNTTHDLWILVFLVGSLF